MTFFESLDHYSRIKGGPLCVGIDPRIEPDRDSYNRLVDYGRRVVESCAPYAVAFKPQLAFFECHGCAGWNALDTILEVIRAVDPGFPIILDAKRGDIGSTAEAYACSLLDRPGNLAVTLSPYLGRESVEPFLRRSGRGVFVLCRTTNPGAEELQGRLLDDGTPLYLAVADEALSWNPNPQSPSIGLVVAGNNAEVLMSVRRRHPDAWFLSPGIGAQGGEADVAVSAGARADGFGILVSASRSVADAEDPGAAARDLRDALDAARKNRKAEIPGVPADDRYELLTGLFRIGAFKTGTFTLKSGRQSPFYIDLRRLSSDPRLLKLSGKAYAGLLRSISADHLAGIPVAALPLATAAAMATGMSLIYPRLETKSHGSGARVEGVWEAGQTAILLDDLITSGNSKREAVDILRSAGLLVNDLVVLIERGDEGRRDMTRAGIRLHAWARIEDLLDAGLSAGYLDEATSNTVRSYVREG